MKNQNEKRIKEANQDEIAAEKEFDLKKTLKHPNPNKRQYSMDDFRKEAEHKITNTIDIPQDEQQYDQQDRGESE